MKKVLTVLIVTVLLLVTVGVVTGCGQVERDGTENCAPTVPVDFSLIDPSLIDDADIKAARENTSHQALVYTADKFHGASHSSTYIYIDFTPPLEVVTLWAMANPDKIVDEVYAIGDGKPNHYKSENFDWTSYDDIVVVWHYKVQ